MFTQLRRTTPRPLILACALSLVAAFFAVRYPDLKGASMGSYVSTLLIALPSAVALFRYLGPRRAVLSLLALSIFGYAIEAIGVATGFPYGAFYYGDALGPRLAGLVPYLLPLSYAPLVVGAVAAAWGTRLPLLHVTLRYPTPRLDGCRPRPWRSLPGLLGVAPGRRLLRRATQ